jgi:hypothetical protein
MSKLKKIPKVSSKKKNQLVRAIKNPIRYFKLDFTRYGGEVCMGTITKEQFEHWYNNDDFEQYMVDVDFDANEANKNIPKEAQFDTPFHEQDDICHLSGPEIADGQIMTITELDKDGNTLYDANGMSVPDEQIDFADFKKKGIKVKCVAEHNPGSKSCKDVHYVFGQYFNKGGWYTEDPIKTGPDGINFKKMKINYEDADGFKVFNQVTIDNVDYYLQEDSTGKSSAFYVMEGDNL